MKTFLAVNEITEMVDYTTQAEDENEAILTLQGELRECLEDDVTIYILSSRTEENKMLFQIVSEDFSETYHFETNR